MRLEEIAALDDPRVADYRSVREAERCPERGLFVVEGRLGVRRLVTESRFRPRSIFLTPSALAGIADALAKLPEATPVYLASRQVLSGVVGYNLHRGCIAAADRGRPTGARELLAACPPQALLVALEDVANPDNVGGVFRNARAFAAAGVLLTPRCADPLSRKATRVSMGGTLQLPFARLQGSTGLAETLRAARFFVVALTPNLASESIETAAAKASGAQRLALLLGTEGEGLSPAALAAADARVRIDMAAGVDSLNLATAAGIALHRFVAARRSGRG